MKPDPPENFFHELSHLPRPIAKLLWQRGVKNAAQARSFLYPTPDDLKDPFLMKNMKEAVERIRRAAQNKETVALVSDYDPDGAAAAAGMVYLFRALGHHHTITYIPNRIRTGVYGITMNIVEDIEARKGTLLIITDCGMSGSDEISAALKKGIDVIVIDHHQKISDMPDGMILVNPYQEGETYPFRDFCAAGLVLKTFQACCGRVDPALFAFAAIGTIADKVPLIDENRAITRIAFENFEKLDVVGLRELAGLCDDDIACCASRLGAPQELYNTNTAFELLVADDGALAKRFVYEMNETFWKEHEALSRAFAVAMEKAASLSERKIVVLSDTTFSSQLLSPLAGRLSVALRKPVILYTTDNGRAYGSARSQGEVHMVELLKHCAPWLDRFGGHPKAAGFSLQKKSIPGFLECLIQHEDLVLPSEELKTFELDARVEGTARALYGYLERLKPYGMANPAPLLLFDISSYIRPAR